MTVILDEGFEGGANAAAVTMANSDFDTLVETGWTFSTSLSPPEGTKAGRCGATGTTVIASDDFTAMSAGWLRMYLYVDSRPSGNIAIAQMKAGATIRAELQLGASGQLRMRDSGLVAIHTTPNETTPGDAWCRVEWKYDNTAAKQRVRVFTGANLHGSVPDYDSGDITTTAAGTITRLSIGTCNGATMTTYWDSVILDSAAWALPIGGVANTAPTANAGADQANIEPGATVSLDGGASSDSDGSIVSYLWRVVSKTPSGAPSPVLSSTTAQQPTFTAPAWDTPATYVLGLKVTDDDGAQSTEDTVSIGVLEASDYIMISGAWVPAYWRVL